MFVQSLTPEGRFPRASLVYSQLGILTSQTARGRSCGAKTENRLHTDMPVITALTGCCDQQSNFSCDALDALMHKHAGMGEEAQHAAVPPEIAAVCRVTISGGHRFHTGVYLKQL